VPSSSSQEERPLIHYVATMFGCALAGAVLAAVLTGIAAVIWTAVGPEAMSTKYGSLSTLARGYFRGCGIGALLIGLLSPISRWKAGIIVLGWIGAGSLYLTVIGDRWGPIGAWSSVEYGLTAFVVLLVGTVGGLNATKLMGRQ